MSKGIKAKKETAPPPFCPFFQISPGPTAKEMTPSPVPVSGTPGPRVPAPSGSSAGLGAGGFLNQYLRSLADLTPQTSVPLVRSTLSSVDRGAACSLAGNTNTRLARRDHRAGRQRALQVRGRGPVRPRPCPRGLVQPYDWSAGRGPRRGGGALRRGGARARAWSRRGRACSTRLGGTRRE